MLKFSQNSLLTIIQKLLVKSTRFSSIGIILLINLTEDVIMAKDVKKLFRSNE